MIPSQGHVVATKKKPPLTIYQELGEESGVSAVVELFYQKVMDDPRIAKFFTGVDMEKQIEKQKLFLSMVFGGPRNYSGRELTAAHVHLVHRGLDDHHVDALLEDLGAAMKHLGYRQALVARVLALTNSYRPDVLSR